MFFDKITGSRATVYEKLAQELNQPVTKKNSKGKLCMRGLKIIFGQQIYLKWDHYLLRTEALNIFFVR